MSNSDDQLYIHISLVTWGKIEIHVKILETGLSPL